MSDDDGPFLQVTGTKIANSKADLFDGNAELGTNRRLDGTATSIGGQRVWTGMDRFGVPGANHCSNWSSTAGTGEAGNPGLPSAPGFQGGGFVQNGWMRWDAWEL